MQNVWALVTSQLNLHIVLLNNKTWNTGLSKKKKEEYCVQFKYCLPVDSKREAHILYRAINHTKIYSKPFLAILVICGLQKTNNLRDLSKLEYYKKVNFF